MPRRSAMSTSSRTRRRLPHAGQVVALDRADDLRGGRVVHEASAPLRTRLHSPSTSSISRLVAVLLGAIW
jgi:hypothetical protein